MAGDTIIFRDTQISSRAVYQCNTSNEHGYLLANAFVSVLGERPLCSPAAVPPGDGRVLGEFLPPRILWSGSQEMKTGLWGGGRTEKSRSARADRLTPPLGVSLGPSCPGWDTGGLTRLLDVPRALSWVSVRLQRGLFAGWTCWVMRGHPLQKRGLRTDGRASSFLTSDPWHFLKGQSGQGE